MEKPSSHGKKPTPRRMTDSRREQNRIASRNYREKRRQKLALLNQILDPQLASNIGPSHSHEIVNDNANASIHANDIAHEGQPVGLKPATPQTGPNLDVDISAVDEHVVPTHNYGSQLQPFLDNNWSTLSGIPLFGSIASFDGTFRPSTTSSNISPTLLGSLSTPNSTMPDPPLPKKVDESTDKDEALLKVLQGANDLSLNQKRDLIQLLQQQTQYTTNDPSPSSPSFTQSSQYLPNDNIPNSCQPSHTLPSTRLQMEALKFSLALSLTATASPCQTPSQYAMNSGLFSALFANCYALGMCDVQPLLVDEGWSVFGLGPEIGYHPSQLSVVRAKFRNLVPDLRPCDLQLTFAHHPYIDVLPFKALRENIIKALDHDQPVIDEDELCHDLLTGLVCWGSQHNTIGMGATVPWDARCWEPSIWFLHKYRNFVGGWDDEMWKGARWWHNMRGERIHASPQMASSSRIVSG
ncbi:hypothetical protein G7Z17_g10141 [Cylindrodendrum hubeiense]|uniref:BZIP domain-containing protein n=1 Tax=Cylindrodendrum hubeiense TaxID=595255 RepID=A0A9P5H380_9HYPO|nr:hypothetical protein G7Z17_g10141 [Cylindrodendrum hubeiense]